VLLHILLGDDGRWSLTKAITLVMAVYFIYVAAVGAPEPLIGRPIFVAFVLLLGFIRYRFDGRTKGPVPWYDFLFGIIGVGSAIYIQSNYVRITTRLAFFDPLTIGDWFFGIASILLVLELTRRTVGRVLVGIVVAVFVYTLFGKYFPGPLAHPGIRFETLLDQLYMTTNGLFGSLTSLTMAEVMMFIMLGAFLQQAGGSEFFTYLAESTTKRAKGGPAKAAVIGSSLFGTISGSGVANVYATGSVTIPLMIKAGFKPEFAGAVEAVASSLGQLIPPIMGATAFLIAEYSRVSYLDVAKAAILPSFLYVFATYLAVHFETEKLSIGYYVDQEEKPDLRAILGMYGHLVLPIIFLVVLLAQRKTAYYSATWATLSVVIISFFNRHTRLSFKEFIKTIEIAIWRVISIASTMLSAGLAVSALQTTGTPFRLTRIIINLAQGNFALVSVMIAITVIILGMGLPPVGAFLIASVFGGPALIEFGVSPFVAYMFLFLFGITALITPPVCLSSYAAASIAETSFLKTGIQGFLIALPAYIIPFMIVFNPTLLNVFEHGFLFGLQCIFTAVCGIIALVSAVSGYMLTKTNFVQRVILFAISFALIWPGTGTDIVGLLFLIMVYLWQLRNKRSNFITFAR
jgi:TRAP transporter 4TM/12TM fusion protein